MFIKDLIFPKVCVVCGFLGSYICSSCQKELNRLAEERCIYCNQHSPFGLTHYKCKRRFGLDGSTSLYLYNSAMQKIIKAIKYRHMLEVWNEFKSIGLFEAKNKWNSYRPIIKNIIVQPIPLFRIRELQRGFNQAELVTTLIQPIIKGKTTSILLRKKNTQPQANQESAKNRIFNMRGAFIIKRKINNEEKRILLVDDVITSGSTMREAAKILKKAGVLFVYGLTLARG